jgi:hypothetical protein
VGFDLLIPRLADIRPSAITRRGVLVAKLLGKSAEMPTADPPRMMKTARMPITAKLNLRR